MRLCTEKCKQVIVSLPQARSGFLNAVFLNALREWGVIKHMKLIWKSCDGKHEHNVRGIEHVEIIWKQL